MLRLLCKLKAIKDAGVTLHACALFCFLLAINVFFQVVNDAYKSDFGAHPDEGAHVVTALMVRDYLAGGFIDSTNPISYAESYYEAFPKVAIGHYPPLFYLIAGSWLLLGVTSYSFLIFSAVIASVCGLTTFLLGRLFMGQVWALGAAIMFTMSPLAQRCTSVFMSDMMLLGWCLLSAAAFSRFMKKGLRVESLIFGAVASAAILTKLSGILLAALPGLALLFARRLHLLRKPAIWIAPITVSLSAIPWVLLTYRITAEGVMDESGFAYFEKSLPFFSGAMIDIFGVLVMVLALTGMAFSVANAAFGGRAVSNVEAVMIALVISGFCFCLIVPAGLEERYLLVIAPAVFLLAFKSLQSICGNLVESLALSPRQAALVHLLALGVIGVGFSMESFDLSCKQASGFGAIVVAVGNISEDVCPEILVCSDARGEGAIVAAAAISSPSRPGQGVKVCRGSKVLASSDWLGRGYVATHGSVADVHSYIKSAGVQFVAIDHGVPPGKRAEYHNLIGRVVREARGDFIEVGRFATIRRGGEKNDVILYRVALDSAD
ncbi:MAG: hypothetical protein GY899_16970 [Verrucomicrobiaceae bacterium]|nr:hypothetical protein [Verrucomicrobiaceae bacterium]